MNVKCVVAGCNANGDKDLTFVVVNCSEEQYANGDHYNAAEDWARESGYEGPFVSFDENDPPRIFDNFVWSSATIINCPYPL